MITDYLTGEKYEGRRSSGIPPTPYIFLSVYIEFVFSDADMLQDLLYKQRVAADDETVPNYKKVLL